MLAWYCCWTPLWGTIHVYEENEGRLSSTWCLRNMSIEGRKWSHTQLFFLLLSVSKICICESCVLLLDGLLFPSFAMEMRVAEGQWDICILHIYWLYAEMSCRVSVVKLREDRKRKSPEEWSPAIWLFAAPVASIFPVFEAQIFHPADRSRSTASRSSRS